MENRLFERKGGFLFLIPALRGTLKTTLSLRRPAGAAAIRIPCRQCSAGVCVGRPFAVRRMKTRGKFREKNLRGGLLSPAFSDTIEIKHMP